MHRTPLLLRALQKWQLRFLVSLYLLSRICPNCACTQLFFSPIQSVYILLPEERCVQVQALRTCSKGSQVPASLRSGETFGLLDAWEGSLFKRGRDAGGIPCAFLFALKAEGEFLWFQNSACPCQVRKTPTFLTIFLCVHPTVFISFPASHLALTFDIFYWFSLKIGFIFCTCKNILSVMTNNPHSKLPIDVLFPPRQDKFDNPL